MKYSKPPTSATIGPAPIWNPAVGRGTPGGAAAAPGAPHAAEGGPGWVGGAACGGGGTGDGAVAAGGGTGVGAVVGVEAVVGVGAVVGAGADTIRRRPSTHASHPFEHRTCAQSPRDSISITSRPGSRFAAGAAESSGAAQAGRPSVG